MADWEDNKKKQGLIPPAPSPAATMALNPPPPAYQIPPEMLQAMQAQQAQGAAAAQVPQQMPTVSQAMQPGAPIPGSGAPPQVAQGLTELAPAMAATPATTPTFDPEQIKKYGEMIQGDRQRTEDAYKELQRADQNLAQVPKTAQSPFEQQLGSAVQQKLLNLMSGQETVGEKFQKGWDLGQQLSANIIAPLMGHFQHTPGGAIGVNQGIQQLDQAVQQGESRRVAERAARNQQLVSLSNMYENLSPESAKNLKNIFDMTLAARKYNLDQHKEASQNYENATKREQDNMKNFIELGGKANKDDADREMKQLEFGQKASQFEKTETDKTEAAAAKKAEDDRKFGLDQEKLRATQAAASNTKEGKDKELSLKERELQLKAGKDAEGTVKGIRQLLLDNKGKYKNATDYFKQNPVEESILDDQLKAAGSKASAKDLFAKFDETNVAGKDSGSFDLGNFLSRIGGRVSNIVGGGSAPLPAATKDISLDKAAPTAKAGSTLDKALQEAKKRGLQVN